jgi:hypothetical protein
MDSSVRRAIARIEVIRDNVVIRRGTASLVGHRLVLTALHVVADRAADPPEFFSGSIELTFTRQFSTVATVLPGRWNPLEDWVLLTCAAVPADTEPLRLAAIDRDGATWTTYGFPDAEHEGLAIHGTVTNSHGELVGGQVAAYQLYSPEAAAAKGLKAKGLSGAPVIVGNAAIGVIRRAPLEGDRVEAGTLFACPMSLVASHCPEHFPTPVTTISVATSRPHLAAVLRRLTTLLIGTLLLSLVLWYVYRVLVGEAATPEETSLFVVVAGVIVFTAVALRGRSERKKRGTDP